jgi:hypothetical protein
MPKQHSACLPQAGMNMRGGIFHLLPKSLSVVYNENHKLWAFGENITSD